MRLRLLTWMEMANLTREELDNIFAIMKRIDDMINVDVDVDIRHLGRRGPANEPSHLLV